MHSVSGEGSKLEIARMLALTSSHDVVAGHMYVCSRVDVCVDWYCIGLSRRVVLRVVVD